MAETQVGKGHIFGMGSGALGISAVSGYISPNIKTLKLGHTSDVDRIKSQAGGITSLIGSGDYLECTFDFIPEGSSIANAKLSAGIPAVLSGVTITGLPILAIGPFSDALNTNGTNTQPWFYEGGGSVNGESEQKWTSTLPLRRYLEITSATAIT